MPKKARSALGKERKTLSQLTHKHFSSLYTFNIELNKRVEVLEKKLLVKEVPGSSLSSFSITEAV